jgi:hypothetical protein
MRRTTRLPPMAKAVPDLFKPLVAKEIKKAAKNT